MLTISPCVPFFAGVLFIVNHGHGGEHLFGCSVLHDSNVISRRDVIPLAVMVGPQFFWGVSDVPPGCQPCEVSNLDLVHVKIEPYVQQLSIHRPLDYTFGGSLMCNGFRRRRRNVSAGLRHSPIKPRWTNPPTVWLLALREMKIWKPIPRQCHPLGETPAAFEFGNDTPLPPPHLDGLGGLAFSGAGSRTKTFSLLKLAGGNLLCGMSALSSYAGGTFVNVPVPVSTWLDGALVVAPNRSGWSWFMWYLPLSRNRRHMYLYWVRCRVSPR